MTTTVYTSITMILGAAVLIALGISLYSFVFMLVRWKTPKRRGYVSRLLLALAAIPCLIGLQQAMLWLVFLPALGRQQMAEYNAARAETLATSSIVHVGDVTPQFTMTTADAVQFSLPQNGNVVLVNFFATWCGPCQMELPHIEQVWAKHRDDEHFQLLVIGREETTETVQQFRDENGFTFPIAADPDREVYSLFAKELIPRTLVVSPAGRIVYSKAGFYEDDLDELNSVLQEELASIR